MGNKQSKNRTTYALAPMPHEPSEAESSLQSRIGGPTTLETHFLSEHYNGKRIRFSAAVKPEGVITGAGLFIRVYGKAGETLLASDSIKSHSIKGTTEWHRYQLVLDVPEESTRVGYGIILYDVGKFRIKGARVEEAPDEPTPNFTMVGLEE